MNYRYLPHPDPDMPPVSRRVRERVLSEMRTARRRQLRNRRIAGLVFAGLVFIVMTAVFVRSNLAQKPGGDRLPANYNTHQNPHRRIPPKRFITPTPQPQYYTKDYYGPVTPPSPPPAPVPQPQQ